MAVTPGAAVLQLLAERLSVTDTSSCDSNSCTMLSPSSAATSFELPSKDGIEGAGASQEEPAQAEPQEEPSHQVKSPLQTHPTPPTPTLSFVSLPSDIHHLILTDYLPYDSIVALRSTSHYFRSLISPSTLRRLRQNVVSKLLAEEHVLLKKWLPQPYGRYSGRPTTHIPCYSCLQYLPITNFFAYQVSLSRGLGRKRAVERWCKPCGIKYGKIRHGRWMDEVSYTIDDEFRYEEVMLEQLQVSNPCVTCTPRHRYDGQRVWWGCVGCFEKEEKRLQKEDSERRRDVRRHCSRVKTRVKAFVEPENLRGLRQEVGWWLTTRLGWGALVRSSYRAYWWVKDESLLNRMCKTCRTVGRVLDPRQMQEPGQKLSRKAKKAVGAVMGLGMKNEKGSTAEGLDEMPHVAVEDCIICSSGCTVLNLEETNTVIPPTPKLASFHHENHICLPSPRREVRCWRCWRAKRSRRRRRYDNGMAYGFPLPKERWCDGCQAEHARFVAMRREKKKRREVQEEGWTVKEERSRQKIGREEEDVDVGLVGLFEEV